MIKFKVKVLIEMNENMAGETAPVFLMGVPDVDAEGKLLSLDKLELLAQSVIVELVRILQDGIRVHAAAKGIEILPEER